MQLGVEFRAMGAMVTNIDARQSGRSVTSKVVAILDAFSADTPRLSLQGLAERTGRGNPGTAAEIERLIAEITQHESQNNIDIVQQTAQAQARSQMAPGQMAPGQAAPGQAGPGRYFPNSPSSADQNVAGSMPGAGAGYGDYGAPGGPGPGGPAQTYVFPEPAPHRDQPRPPA